MLSTAAYSNYRPDKAARHCTNPVWLGVFCVMLLWMMWAYIYLASNGNLDRLAGLPNGRGLVCGVDAEVANTPFLYLCPDNGVRITDPYIDLVCIKDCPVSIEGHVAASFCGNSPRPDYPTVAIAEKVCYGTDARHFVKLSDLSFRFGMLAFLANMDEVAKVWPCFLVIGFAVIGLSILHLRMLRDYHEEVFWTSGTIFVVATGVPGLYAMFATLQLERELGVSFDTFTNTEFLSGLVCFLSAAVYVIAVARSRLALKACFAAVEASWECINDVPSMELEPVFDAARKVLLTLCFVPGLLLLISDYNRTENPDKSTFTITYDASSVFLGITYIFSWTWIFEFANALSWFIYAYATEVWFYADFQEKENTKNVRHSILWEAYHAAGRFHLGTLAYGSLVLIVTRPIRIVVDYLTRPIRHEVPGTQPGLILRFSRTWLGQKIFPPLVDLYENRLRCLRKSAFMDVALNGKGFIASAEDADWFLSGKTAVMARFDGTAFLMSVAGTLCVASFGVCLTRLLCAIWPDYSVVSSANYVMEPTFVSLVAGIACCIVAWPFFLMTDHVADSIFFCFCLDQKSYGLGKSIEEREALSRGCNFQSLFGTHHSPTDSLFHHTHHPPKTMTLYQMTVANLHS